MNMYIGVRVNIMFQIKELLIVNILHFLWIYYIIHKGNKECLSVR